MRKDELADRQWIFTHYFSKDEREEPDGPCPNCEKIANHLSMLFDEYGIDGCQACWGISNEADGVCPECERTTIGGVAASGCIYSDTDCDYCGASPCTQDCDGERQPHLPLGRIKLKRRNLRI